MRQNQLRIESVTDSVMQSVIHSAGWFQRLLNVGGAVKKRGAVGFAAGCTPMPLAVKFGIGVGVGKK